MILAVVVALVLGALYWLGTYLWSWRVHAARADALQTSEVLIERADVTRTEVRR